MAIKGKQISLTFKEDYVLVSVQKILDSIYQLAVPIATIIKKDGQVIHTYNKHTEEIITYYKKRIEERKRTLFGQYYILDSGV